LLFSQQIPKLIHASQQIAENLRSNLIVLSDGSIKTCLLWYLLLYLIKLVYLLEEKFNFWTNSLMKFILLEITTQLWLAYLNFWPLFIIIFAAQLVQLFHFAQWTFLLLGYSAINFLDMPFKLPSFQFRANKFFLYHFFLIFFRKKRR